MGYQRDILQSANSDIPSIFRNMLKEDLNALRGIFQKCLIFRISHVGYLDCPKLSHKHPRVFKFLPRRIP